jgi:uncharacterized protein
LRPSFSHLSSGFPFEARSRTPLPSPPEFSLSVHDLDAAGRSFRLPVRAAWIRGAMETTEVGSGLVDGHLDLRLSKSGTDVVVRGTLRAELTVPCARCLEPAEILVDEDLSALAVATPSVRGRKASGEDDDGGSDDADTFAYDGDSVVLDDLIRDLLLLGIPMIPLCSDACPGIRPKTEDAPWAAGDPRMRPLMSTKQK